MTNRLVAVDDADYRLPEPVLGALASDMIDEGNTLGAQLSTTFARGVSVESFGAKGDGVTDDTAAVQAAIDSGESVYFPPGTYVVSGLTVRSGMRLYGSSRSSDVTGAGRSRLRTLSGTMFLSPAYTWGVVCQDLTFDSFTGGGHIFTGKYSQSKFDSCAFTQYNDGFSAFDIVGWIDVLSVNCSYTHTLTATVPTFKGVTSTGELAQSTFTSCRFTHTGNYGIWLEGQNGSIPISFAIRDVNFEIPVGGAVKLLSCRNVVIENCGLWDFHDGGATRDLVYIGKSATVGAESNSITVENLIRDASDAPEAGVVDIRVAPASATNVNVIECRHQTSGRLAVDMGSVTGRVTGGRVTVTNGGLTTNNAAPFPGRRLGARLPLACYPAAMTYGVSAVSMLPDAWRFMPLTLDRPIALSGLAVILGTAAASGTAAMRFGLWSIDSTGRPSTLVIDFGALATLDLTGATAERTMSFATQTIAAGDYFVGCAWSGTATTHPSLVGFAGTHPSISSNAASTTTSAYTQAVSGATTPSAPSTALAPAAGIAVWGINA
ncbi:right-handed parallel beta-helix repeat-containing protein [Microbacterium murale]|uniref:Rhamnogalacturonase A/B/Epimerase-like pectate lyase domain-containing protein n=1 Tax=Microbacterium murale TaxID=1081040 RepID=A0ABQ1RUG2_9MICO|nr:right-handed parallel beta-helix repeat-containing protein [Microbacterium murale]GGD83216.1 hypothetical protein GCM10007269_27590 [Microbacterium murale]